ncbi:DnaJ-domain-containing protein [Stipitochalara longipes BDJ]|nr:DnaJ-domain-containing protein [Stipitochalara longipes BDJ]
MTLHNAKLYAMLGLPQMPSSGPTEIRKAYYATALQLHPDKNPDDPRATIKFQNITTAYETLLSSCVTVEEYEEVSEKGTSAADEEDDNHGKISKERREAKKFQKEERKEENAKAQKAAHAKKARMIREDHEDLMELLQLEKQINCGMRKLKSGKPGEDDALQLINLENISRLNALVLKLQNQRKRKALIPELNGRDLDSIVLESEAKIDILAASNAAKRDEEFMDREIPTEFVIPDASERERVRKNRSELFVFKEAEEEEKAKELGEKMCEFWGRRETLEKIKKSSTIHRESKTVDPVPRTERDSGDWYTRKYSETLAQEQKMSEPDSIHGVTAVCLEQIEQTPISPNVNLSLSLHVDCNKQEKRRGTKCREKGKNTIHEMRRGREQWRAEGIWVE